jgi:glycosyltransferase involved in cell wall biosynthesis
MTYKLAALAPHPIQYQAPLFRKLADHPDIDLTVYFCWDFGETGEVYEPGFDKMIKWDIPLLEGYKYKFLPNLSPRAGSSFLGQINPSIIKELFNNKYDAVWIHGYATLGNWFAFLGAWLSKTPVILRGESHLLNYRPVWKRLLKWAMLMPLFKRVNAFLAIGALNKEYYQNYDVSEKKIFHVPYIADEDFFGKHNEKYESKDNEIRKELGLSRDDVIILYVGKIFGQKGPGAFDLVKAFEKLQDVNQVSLVFVGDGKEKHILEKYVKDKEIKNVIFAGFKNQTELPKYYQVADIFVLPSHTEQWGMAINEAMYFDTAIVASGQVGAAYDLIRDGENGYKVPVAKADVLAGYLRNLIRDRELLHSMKIESRRIIQDWNLETAVSGVLDALNYLKRR